MNSHLRAKSLLCAHVFIDDERRFKFGRFRRVENDRAVFLLMSLWESCDAIKRFAGPNFERAVYYPEDEKFLLELEPNVVHCETLA